MQTGTQGTAAIAHVRQTDDGWQTHPLEDHLRAVATRADEFARCFGASDWARLAGLWHDLGKYAPDFQHYIRDASGYEREQAHIEDGRGEDGKSRQRVDHSAAGAIHAVDRLGTAGIVIANLIAAHHAGLYDRTDLERRLQSRDRLDLALSATIASDVLDTGSAPALAVPGGASTPGAYALWLRMLFSCLVDADFLDTEHFMDEGAKAGHRADFPALPMLKAALDRHLTVLAQQSEPPTAVNRLRAQVLADCRRAAIERPGLFSLTVPTGGGKTLSSLAFALDHAAAHGKCRVIYVIPYTSIIEQTAKVFRDVLGDAVVEHHSNADAAGDEGTSKSRLASENWDAPVIVTTNVQFFESLFAARTSHCRKLHNIVDSVVVLDEAQLLPPAFLQPILDVLNLLARHYGVTVLLCTATQPALGTKRYFDGRGMRGLDDVREIMPDPAALYAALKRVEVALPEDFHTRRSWVDVAQELAAHDDVLAIVNRRADARELHGRLPDGALHLSGLMCAAHRSDIIDTIKQRLESRRRGKDMQPVRVVSTQLVEAGVDIDFPVVYRALAGLDSIAQAAGRCNREGRLRDSDGQPQLGQVVVFVPETAAPPGLLRQGEQATISLLTGHVGDPLDHHLFDDYFTQLYRGCDLDEKHIGDELDPHKYRPGMLNLRSASDKFTLIDNEESGYRSVYVPYRRDAADEEFGIWVATLRKEGVQRWLLRKLQRYSVNLPGRQFDQLLRRGDLDEVKPGIFVLKSDAQYDKCLGLLLDEPLSPSQLCT
jgi:CRISPR-associated endonuclease/helicase Cas3